MSKLIANAKLMKRLRISEQFCEYLIEILEVAGSEKFRRTCATMEIVINKARRISLACTLGFRAPCRMTNADTSRKFTLKDADQHVNYCVLQQAEFDLIHLNHLHSRTDVKLLQHDGADNSETYKTYLGNLYAESGQT